MVGLLAFGAAGLVVLAQRLEQLWVAVAALSGVFAGGGVLLHIRSAAVMRELDVLREHLEATRQHAGLLARHTRELRETFMHGVAADDQPIRPADFATLSALVRDLADGVAELDKRGEAVETELADLRRVRPAEKPAQPSWVAPSRPQPGFSTSSAAAMYGAVSPSSAAAAHASSGYPGLGGASRQPAPPASYAEPAPAFDPLEDPLHEIAPSFPPMQAESRSAPEPRVIQEVPQAPRPAATNEPPRAVRQLVAAAIAADRFDLFLQRVVGLPQRRTRAYDVSLRPDGSDVAIPNSDIRQAVEAVGHQLAFDRKLMIQAVRLARVFEQRDRDVLLFADISQRFLMSEAAFDELDALVADVPAAPRRIVLTLPQRFFKKAVAFEHEALRTLGRMGFSFAMRDVEDLDLDLAKLEQSGVRWVRMAAGRFLALTQAQDTVLDVASADFVALLQRRRISFLADQVTEEAQIAELLDLNVEYAHGLVFAPPQAVRADVLEGAPSGEPPRTPEPTPERRGLRDLARRA